MIKISHTIKAIFKRLMLGRIKRIEYVPSSQNKVYKITTNDKKYYIKQYSRDAIKNNEDLLNRKRQIAISTVLSENGVPTIVPLMFNDSYLIKYNKHYYLLYDYYPYETIDPEDLNTKHIKKLANTLAIIHKTNIKSNLNCQYREIKIDLPQYLIKFKKINEELYMILKEQYQRLEQLISNCNDNITKVKENLCVSHNDYKLKNILWDNEYMYLLDFDASAMSNPTVSFAEAAFALSLQDQKLNQDFYKEFIKSYLKKYGDIKESFETALYVCMNGKLQWLEYLMSKCSKLNKTSIEDTKSMIKELSLFIDSQEIMLNIYNEHMMLLNETKDKKEKKKRKNKYKK